MAWCKSVLWHCIVSFICIGKGAPMLCGEQNLDSVLTPLHCVSWHLLSLGTHSHCTRNHKHIEAALLQTEQRTVTPAGVTFLPLLLLLLPGQMPSAVCYFRLPRAWSLGLPKCVLSFWQQGLEDPETDLVPASAAPCCACLLLTFPALQPLPLPHDLWDYSCSAFSRRRPLSCCCSVEGDYERGKKKIPL